MGIVVASVVGILVIALVAYIAFVVLGARASAAAGHTDPVDAPGVEVLRYDVPDGQDPVVVVSALRKAGYDPATDLVEGSTVVVVPCPGGASRERDRVREVIAGASETTLEGPEFDPGRVTFEDEKSA
jgi:hypothetical protein